METIVVKQQTVNLGSTATIVCETELENETIIWYKNHEKILESSDHYTIIADGRKNYLVIRSIDFFDAAEYSVEIGGKKERHVVTQLIVEGKSFIFKLEIILFTLFCGYLVFELL